jgi:LysM repeat protein
MKPLKLIIFFLFAATTGRTQSPAIIRQYIDSYKAIAIEEMQRTGVPAAITLAQGIHETGAGQSALVRKSNNHFGIKCKTGWQGESVHHDDDELGECFRKYADPADSYKDHSDFLKDRKHYGFLFTLDPMDYEGWAYGLKKAGYATNPKYPQILIKLIKDYSLQDYTLIALGKKEAAPDEVWASTTTDVNVQDKNNAAIPVAAQVVYPQGVFKINETEVVFVPKGTPYLAVAEEHNISLGRLFEFNDLQQAETAPADGLLFLHRKRKRGAHKFYTVIGNETLHQVAQAEGMRLESLLGYNFLNSYMQPAAGAVLYLQDKAPAAPKLVTPKQVIAASVFNPANGSDLSAEDAFIVHTVQPKETVYGISKKYAVTSTDILKWNNLGSSYLKTGQQLRINKGEKNAAN